MDFGQIAQLGGTVVTVAMFIWYLLKRNASVEKALRDLAQVVGETNKVLERHSAQDVQAFMKILEQQSSRE